MNEEYKLIKVECPYCKHDISHIEYFNYGRTKCESGICEACGHVTYVKNLTPFDSKPIVECPYCHSQNTKKISTASKIGKVAMFGFFALDKTSKQWHCNECKSDF